MNRPNQNDFLARPVPRNPAADHAFAANMSMDRWPRTAAEDLDLSCGAHSINPALTIHAANYTYLRESSPPGETEGAQCPSTIFQCCRRCVPQCSGTRCGSAFCQRMSPTPTRLISSHAIW